jgi:uncharacterized protein
MFARNAIIPIVTLFALGARAAESADRLVHVSGQGDVEVAPDQAVLQLTVTTVDDDLLRVRANSDKEARAILSDAKKYGALDKGFHVSSLKLSLEYNDQLRRQIYHLQRDVTLELNDLTRLDHLLLDLLHEPNLNVKSITFTTTKWRQYNLDALKRAVADARDKAQQLAELNGLKLGKARDIRVSSETQTPFVISVIPVVGSAQHKSQHSNVRNQRDDENPFGSRGKSPAGKAFVLVAVDAPDQQGDKHDEAQPDGKPFAVGTISVTAQVEVDFEMKE